MLSLSDVNNTDPIKGTPVVLALILAAVPLAFAQHTYPGSLNFPSSAPTSQVAPSQVAPEKRGSAQSANEPAKSAVDVAGKESTAPAGVRRVTFTVNAGQPWTDTSLDLKPGDRVVISSEGALNFAKNNIANKATPDGLPRTWYEVITPLPVNSAGIGALIGRIGSSDAEVPFLIGSRKEMTVSRAGRLFLGVNEPANTAGEGAYSVSVEVTPDASNATQVIEKNVASPKLPSDVFGRIPRRITDENGNPGDMVNFLIIGPEEQMKKVFVDANWVLVDKTKTEATLHALLSTYSKKVYTEMPMSELYLYGRPQDYGFARAEPVQVVQSRHHLRIWKAPFEVGGQSVWVGAATHDIGFEHDNRGQGALSITHKIDPDVDKEREFVSQTLSATGEVAAATKVTPPDPLRTARTATGGSFHSDGQILVLQLAGKVAAAQ